MKAEKKITDFELDKRVRDRLVAAGTLDAKVVERYLAELPDLESASEKLPYAQPALSGSSDADDDEDEDEDDDDDAGDQ